MFVHPWFGNISKRLIKAPKIYFTDTFVKDKFIRGVVLYRGKNILPFDKKFIAVSIDLIWNNMSM